jgi:hypothetical protein
MCMDKRAKKVIRRLEERIAVLETDERTDHIRIGHLHSYRFEHWAEIRQLKVRVDELERQLVEQRMLRKPTPVRVGSGPVPNRKQMARAAAAVSSALKRQSMRQAAERFRDELAATVGEEERLHFRQSPVPCTNGGCRMVDGPTRRMSYQPRAERPRPVFSRPGGLHRVLRVRYAAGIAQTTPDGSGRMTTSADGKGAGAVPAPNLRRPLTKRTSCSGVMT